MTSGQGVLWTAHESHRTDALTDITALIIEGEGLADVMSRTSGFAAMRAVMPM